jgi:competence protein ComEA
MHDEAVAPHGRLSATIEASGCSRLSELMSAAHTTGRTSGKSAVLDSQVLDAPDIDSHDNDVSDTDAPDIVMSARKRSRNQRSRDYPRFHFALGHAVIVIVLLVAALCASLTLLLQQASNYAAFQRQTMSLQEQQISVSPDVTLQQGQSMSPQSESAEVTSATPQISAEASTSSAPSEAVEPSNASPIDLNTASDSELMQISGIGPVTAEKILEFRQLHGRFSSVEQLLDVQGIGVKKLELIRPFVTVSSDS